MDDLQQQTELAEWLRTAGGYRDARVLADGSVAAVIELFTTRALCLGCNRDGWESRFCFDDKRLADQRFVELRSEDDTPAGFIAQRGQKNVAVPESEGGDID